MDVSRKEERAMLRCAFVGGLKEESRTKRVFAGAVTVGLEKIGLNKQGEAAKEERVWRRKGRREVISTCSEGVIVVAGDKLGGG